VPKNEDGEFELILGNRQLLSVFFIVVVLFALFFVMGYILGRPAGPGTVPEVASARKVEKPLVVESPARDPNPAPVAAKTESEPPPSTPEKAKPAEPAKVESAKAKPEPAPAKSERAKTPPPEKKAEKPEPPKPAASNEPASGTYLQLTATGQHEADLYADVLRKKGFHAVEVDVPDKHLTRVLVGPLSEGNVNKTKADLKAAGFPGDQAIKRTY